MREAFTSQYLIKMAKEEENNSLKSLVILKEKRERSIKTPSCDNVRKQRDSAILRNAESPTAATENFLITASIDTK